MKKASFDALKRKGVNSRCQAPLKVRSRGVIARNFFVGILVEDKVLSNQNPYVDLAANTGQK